MKEYLCGWMINVEADSHEEAAEIAERLMDERLESHWRVRCLDIRESGAPVSVKIGPDE